MSKGKMIVFEGIDGSGKSTQYRLLCEELERRGVPFRRLVFPQYEEESSALIRMYLRGEFGSKPGDVNAFAASAFFAVDRYASYKKDWGAWFESGGLIVTDRYTTSNAVHQASKLPEEEREPFFRWLKDFEFDKLGLPAPDLVLFLDVTTEAAAAQRRAREAATGTEADIHERDRAYLEQCRAAANAAAGFYGWRTVNCMAGGTMRSIEEIREELLGLVLRELCLPMKP